MSQDSGEFRKIVAANKAATAICFAIFVLSLLVALITDSVVLLLDSTGWLIGGVTGIAYDRVLKTIRRPSSPRYHFGYAKFEPLSLVLEAALIVASCVFTLKLGVQDLIHPDEISGYGLAIALTFSTGVVGLVLAGYLALVGWKYRSPLLRANALSWLVDSVFAFGVFGGFVVAERLAIAGRGAWAAYVDPLMGILLASAMLPAPLKMLKHYLGELLDENPGGAEEERVRQLVESYRATWGMAETTALRIRKAGTKLFVDVCFLADSAKDVQRAVDSVDELDRAVAAAIGDTDLSVRFRVRHDLSRSADVEGATGYRWEATTAAGRTG